MSNNREDPRVKQRNPLNDTAFVQKRIRQKYTGN